MSGATTEATPRQLCGRGESNPHARRHQILSLAWLPLHHSRVDQESRSSPRGCPRGPADELAERLVWQAVAVPRDPRQIQLEIDAARESLAATLDQLTYRTSPKRLKAKGKDAVQRLLQTPAGMADRRRGRPAGHLRRRPEDPAPQRLTPMPPVRPDPVGPGQESVWDYPRPPSAEVTGRHVVVELGGQVVADTRRAVRVCETSHPPVYYVPREDVADGVLERGRRRLVVRVEGRGDLLGRRRRRPAGARGRLVLRGPEPRASSTCAAPSRSTPAGSTGRSSTASTCGRSRAASTAAGSPTTSSARSRASRARSAGSRSRRPARADRACRRRSGCARTSGRTTVSSTSSA